MNGNKRYRIAIAAAAVLLLSAGESDGKAGKRREPAPETAQAAQNATPPAGPGVASRGICAYDDLLGSCEALRTFGEAAVLYSALGNDQAAALARSSCEQVTAIYGDLLLIIKGSGYYGGEISLENDAGGFTPPPRQVQFPTEQLAFAQYCSALLGRIPPESIDLSTASAVIESSVFGRITLGEALRRYLGTRNRKPDQGR